MTVLEVTEVVSQTVTQRVVKMINIPQCSKLKMKGKKTKPVPILLSRASRNFPDVKTRNEKKLS